MADPASPSTRRVLFESLGISVVDFRCHAGVEKLGSEEPNPTHSIVFVRRGVFGRAHEHGTLVADPNYVLFFNAAQPYRYSHPVEGGDDCTILAVETSRALELVSGHAPHDPRPERPFRLSHGLSSRRAAELHWELLRLIDRPALRLSLEDVLAELADEAIGGAYRAPGEPIPRLGASAPARRRHRELAEAAKLLLNERLDAPPSLDELAGGLGCSPFHLSRTFHGVVGLSLRQYVKRLRARLAAERLAAGARDLTSLALDFGYFDHSHFTKSFRHEWGIPPSRFRAARSGAESAREGPPRRRARRRN
jgi:AraC family transcriptional regulator